MGRGSLLRLITGVLAVSAVGEMGSSCNVQALWSENTGPGATDRVKDCSRVVYTTWGTMQPGSDCGAGAAKTAVGTSAMRASGRVRTICIFTVEWYVGNSKYDDVCLKSVGGLMNQSKVVDGWRVILLSFGNVGFMAGYIDNEEGAGPG